MKKSEMMRIDDRRDDNNLARILGCKTVNLLVKYLELLLRFKYRNVKTWEPLIEIFERRLAGLKRVSAKGWKVNTHKKHTKIFLFIICLL